MRLGSRRRLFTALFLLAFGAVWFGGGFLLCRAVTPRVCGGWVSMGRGVMPGGRTIAARLGKYSVWVSLFRPRGYLRAGSGASAAGVPRAGLAEEIEKVTRPNGGELIVDVTGADLREGMVSISFRPHGPLGVPATTLSAGLPGAGAGATSFWTLYGLSGRLATKVEGRAHREILYYHVEGRWVPAVQVRLSGRPRGTVLVWRNERFGLDPQVGYWVGPRRAPEEPGRAPQTRKSRGAE